MDIIRQIEQQLEQIEIQKLNAVKEVRKQFTAFTQPFFDNHPEITSFSWTQYTDYWNDGEECEFKVRLNYNLEVNGLDTDDIPELDWRISRYLAGEEAYKNLLIQNPSINIKLYKSIEEIKLMLEVLPNEFYLNLFGDHAKVILYSNGEVEVEEYEHD